MGRKGRKHKEKTERDFTSFFAQRRGGPAEYVPLCKDCKRRHPWGKLVTKYEFQGSDLFRLWVGPCGNVVRQDNISDLMLVYEL